MLEALGCILSAATIASKPVQCYLGFRFLSGNRSLLWLPTKIKIPNGHDGQLMEPIFQQTNVPPKRYKNFRKWAPRAMPLLGNDSEESWGGGDKRTQDLLVEIAMLQVEKVRVAEFVAERSAHLAQIAEQTNTELDQIAENTMKGIDDAGFKVMESMEAEAQACEEKLASARAEIETKEQAMDKFEKQMWKGYSEGLFFKTLYTPLKKLKDNSPEKQNDIQMEADMLKEVTKKAIKSSFRRNLYLFLIFILSFALIDVVATGNVEWPKLAIYTTLLVILVAQLSYETIFSSNVNDVENK